jgi:hypothetical protein
MGGGGGAADVNPLLIFVSDTDGKGALSTAFDFVTFFAPIIIIVGVFILSVFSSSVAKAFVFMFWFFVITAIRNAIVAFSDSGSKTTGPKNVCTLGVFAPFIPNTNLTYSTFILAFTMFYFIFPMILLINDNKSTMFNYRILVFFIAYIVFDLLIKQDRLCLKMLSITSIIGDLVGGIVAGISVSSIMYYTNSDYMFINEASSNAEVCSMPSKQQFKCSVYKNGELVSSSVN